VALVAAYALLGVAGIGMLGAVVHATWFGLVLTRKGRVLLFGLSTILLVGWLMACATPGGLLEICAGSVALALLGTCAWMAVSGMDRLESAWHGWATESRCRVALERLVKTSSSKLIARHGVLLRSGNHFTEIDHLLLTPVGLVVIETKGYTGRIEFDADSGRWWRSRRSGESAEIDNPLAQNEGHIRAVRSAFRDVPVFGLVVMTDAEIGETVPEGAVTLETLWRSLVPWIHEMGGSLDVEGLARRLAGADQASAANRRAHLASVQRFRGDGINPLWQQRLAAFAAVLYFGIPFLLLIAGWAGGYPSWPAR
jgi:hypothetical protein